MTDSVRIDVAGEIADMVLKVKFVCSLDKQLQQPEARDYTYVVAPVHRIPTHDFRVCYKTLCTSSTDFLKTYGPASQFGQRYIAAKSYDGTAKNLPEACFEVALSLPEVIYYSGQLVKELLFKHSRALTILMAIFHATKESIAAIRDTSPILDLDTICIICQYALQLGYLTVHPDPNSSLSSSNALQAFVSRYLIGLAQLASIMNRNLATTSKAAFFFGKVQTIPELPLLLIAHSLQIKHQSKEYFCSLVREAKSIDGIHLRFPHSGRIWLDLGHLPIKNFGFINEWDGLTFRYTQSGLDPLLDEEILLKEVRNVHCRAMVSIHNEFHTIYQDYMSYQKHQCRAGSKDVDESLECTFAQLMRIGEAKLDLGIDFTSRFEYGEQPSQGSDSYYVRRSLTQITQDLVNLCDSFDSVSNTETPDGSECSFSTADTADSHSMPGHEHCFWAQRLLDFVQETVKDEKLMEFCSDEVRALLE